VDGLKINKFDIHEDDSDKQVILRNVKNPEMDLPAGIFKIVE